VSRPGDLVSADASLRIGIGPAERAGMLLVGSDVSAAFFKDPFIAYAA
jgi:hypothetical protein